MFGDSSKEILDKFKSHSPFPRNNQTPDKRCLFIPLNLKEITKANMLAVDEPVAIWKRHT